MGTHTPNATGGNFSVVWSAPVSSPVAEGTTVRRDTGESTWDRSSIKSNGLSHDEDQHVHQERGLHGARGQSPTSIPSTHSSEEDLTEQLAELIMNANPGPNGEELAEAFRSAAELPPVTKQTLSELDINNIITNNKLRHDINLDCDLSFRPNLDGPKGHEKVRQSQKFWRALVAELELYVRLFQGTPPLSNSRHVNWSAYIHHAKRRIPKMFETIHEVLKSLVPERDHSRVDEHLDVPKLMQEIERGVCDLVRLAEWMAHLLKEHCAPMRDVWVDEMVVLIRSGTAQHRSDLIVSGLQKLFGILEAMKLDVANHQIRNLRTILIEDTLNFANHYHLDRLVNGHARVNIDAAQKWWAGAGQAFRQQCTTVPRDTSRFQLEVFARAVVSTLFRTCRFPDTFYLDQDRLRVLKLELDELVHFEICLEMFGQLLNEFGYNVPVSRATRDRLRISLSAIIGEGIGHGPQSWMMNSEPISLELYRQALLLSGRLSVYNYDDLQTASQRLRAMFVDSFSKHASALEAVILRQVLACTSRHFHSSPIDLFNNLVTPAPALPPLFSPHSIKPPQNPFDMLPQDKITALSNRITHILLLHWRIWGPIAYIQDDDISAQIQSQSFATAQSQTQTATTTTTTTSSTAPISTWDTQPTPSPRPHSTHNAHTAPPPQPLPNADPEAQVVSAMKTGDPPDPGETKVARETSLQ